MLSLTTRLSLLVVLILPLLLVTSITSINASEARQTGPLSTLSDVAFYPIVANGKTDIAVSTCANVANFQLRSEKAGAFLSEIFVRSVKCPPSLSGSWRIVIGAAPNECFTIYVSATETALADANFMARAARYSVCVSALGALSSPQRQMVTAPAGDIENPSAGASVQGTVAISGWAIDAAAWSGTGVDKVEIYNGANLLGTATYGQARNDIAATYSDSRYTNAGYSYQLDTKLLTNGSTTLQVRYHSVVTDKWSSVDRAVTITNPTVGIPVPQPPPPPAHTGDWPVPYYNQGDATWGNNKIGACTNTIRNVGCALTSLAMIFKFYGVDQNPGTLNNCLGSDACQLNWGSSKIASCSGRKVSWSAWPRFNTQAELYARLEQELKTRPVILEISNNIGQMHFIVVLGGSGSNPSSYRVHDPGVPRGAHNNLKNTLDFWYKFNNFHFVPKSMRLYSGTPAFTAADISLATTSPSALAAPQPSASESVSGTVVIYATTDNGVILELAAQSSTSAVTDMRVWTDQQPSDIWQPFSPYVQVPLDAAIYVQFRDAADNLSATIKADAPVASLQETQQNIQKVFLPLMIR